MPGGFVRFIALFELGSSVVRPLHCCATGQQTRASASPRGKKFLTHQSEMFAIQNRLCNKRYF